MNLFKNNNHNIRFTLYFGEKSLHYILALISLIFIYVHDVKANEYNFSFSHITSDQGLSHNTVTCIYQDYLGFIWFGTPDGLNRYDGYSLTKYRNIKGDSSSLSYNFVATIYEDKNKTLWIGTTGGGLHKYLRDYDKFKNFAPYENTNQRYIPNDVRVIFEDSKGHLWLGTNGDGLVYFDRKKEKFHIFRNDERFEHSICDNVVLAITEDNIGNLWLGTDKGGLNLMVREDTSMVNGYSLKDFICFKHNDKDASTICHNTIWALHCDDKNNLWIGTYGGGLDYFDTEKQEFIHYYENENSDFNLNSLYITSIFSDRKGRLWIGTDGDGLFLLNSAEDRFVNIRMDEFDKTGLNNNTIRSIFQDQSGDLWFGTFGGGVNYYNHKKEALLHYYKKSYHQNWLNHNSILAFTEDDIGNIWVGTDGGGLNYFDRINNKFYNYQKNSNNANSLSSNAVLSLCYDKKGNLWIGTYEGGLNLFDKSKKKFIHFKHDKNDKNSLGENTIWEIFEDSDKNLWVGTNGGGLNLFNYEKNCFKRFVNDINNPNSISGNGVISICEDRDENIWIGTWGSGLNCYDKQSDTFTSYKHNEDEKYSLSSNAVLYIYEDTKGRLWVGTYMGLNYFDRENNKFIVYDEKSGFPNNTINGILEDDEANLWLSTNNGLIKFNPESKKIIKFQLSDGMQGNQFNRHACFKTSKNELLFGGSNGFNLFDPQDLQPNMHPPKVYITDFKIFNQHLTIGDENSPLKKHISALDKIKLKYNQNIISFEYVALNYAAPLETQYAFMLEGLEKEWNYVGSQRIASYSNLGPGNYKFRVKVSDKNGNWNIEGKNIKLVVTPPYWHTLWFRILAVALFIIILGLGYRVRMRSVQARNRKLEEEVKERTKEIERQANKLLDANHLLTHEILNSKRIADELNAAKIAAEHAAQTKSDFLANMSHEIRTPMNGVLGMIRLLLDTQITTEQCEYLEMIKYSGESLLIIIDDILDFSKIEAGRLELEIIEFHLVEIMKAVVNILFPKANEKGLAVNLDIDERIPGYLLGDSIRIQQILFNFGGNAIKFTEKGNITIKAELANDSDTNIKEGDRALIRFSVQDSGIGIPKEKHDSIFESFTQADTSTTRKFGGTGLGLTISKKLAELMGGQVGVESKINVGSTFWFTANLKIAENQSKQRVEEKAAAEFDFKLKHLKILVAEDNMVNQKLIQRILEKQGHEVELAEDGVKALENFEKNIYDVILMDVQMPEMDGFNTTKEIRNMEKAKQGRIPIIALTANAMKGDREKCIAVGMDGYITKPIHPEKLFQALYEQVEQKSN